MQSSPTSYDYTFVAFPGHYRHRSLGLPFVGGREAGPVQYQPPTCVIDPYSPYRAPGPRLSPSLLLPGWDIPPFQIGLLARLIPDTLDKTNLARRPRDWRAAYNPRASFLSNLLALSSFSKNRSDVQGDNSFFYNNCNVIHHRIYIDPIKRRLTSSLEYDAGRPPVIHDLRHNTYGPIFHARTLTNDRQTAFSDLDIAQFATTPPARFLRLFHPKLPWYIDIQPLRPNGIIVGDVLFQLYAQLRQQILPQHYWNDVLSQQDRSEISNAYMRRTRESDEGHGILWIDFLCDEVVFEGLIRTKGGLWEIKTRNICMKNFMCSD